jgi:hypothetical protein
MRKDDLRGVSVPAITSLAPPDGQRNAELIKPVALAQQRTRKHLKILYRIQSRKQVISLICSFNPTFR